MNLKELARDPVIIFGLAISWASSIGLLISRQDNLLGFSVGVAGTVITLLIDIMLQVKRYEANLIEIMGLSKRLHQDTWLYEAVQEIVKNCVKIHEAGETNLFTNAMVSTIESCRLKLLELSKGRLILPAGEDTTLQLDLANDAKVCGKTTSLVDATGWWQTAEGQKYLQANIEAVVRGIKITRIFILPKSGFDEAKSEIGRQAKHGIDVQVVFEEDIPLVLLEDFALWDDKTLLRGESTRQGEIRKSVISVDELDIKETLQTFQKLMVHAKPLDSLKAIPDTKA